MHGDDAAKQFEEAQKRVSDFARAAREHEFIFHDMDGRGRTAHIGAAQPKAMALVADGVDKTTPELGRTYQRLLSATAHSAVHRLARMLTPISPSGERTGEVLAAVNVGAQKLAVELAVGPLTAHSLARGIEWFTGCDMSRLQRPANQMLDTWSRIGRMRASSAS